MTVDWLDEARRGLLEMRAHRVALHREPELSNHETRTRAKIVAALRSLGLEPRTYDGGFNGVRAVIAPHARGPTVAVRADMDGLPVTEETGLPFSSTVPGRMHACGHDVHMSCLLGAARVWIRHESTLRGPIVLLFQPAEEEGTVGGAQPFIERGCLERPNVDFVVGQHVAPEIPLGSVGYRSGPMMAAADHFKIRIGGHSGHAGYPHRGPDAVLAAAEIVTGFQAIVSRMRDPLDPAVISVGSIHGGTRDNVLPSEVTLEGTVRTFRAETRDLVERALRRRVTHLAKSGGASARISYRRGYPVTTNDRRATERVVESLREDLGPNVPVELERPVMGAEDFSRYLEKVPGTFLFLGVGGKTPGTLHSSVFAPDDRALVVGAATLAAAATGLQRGAT